MTGVGHVLLHLSLPLVKSPLCHTAIVVEHYTYSDKGCLSDVTLNSAIELNTPPPSTATATTHPQHQPSQQILHYSRPLTRASGYYGGVRLCLVERGKRTKRPDVLVNFVILLYKVYQVNPDEKPTALLC